ncbi:MAG: hypothetical protein KDD02_15250 [Phaeodactylibacter sp.]|nr:hypothetical protein [Phaeodactylibacter sp.]
MKQHIFSLFIAAIALSSCTKDKDAFCPPPSKQCDSTLYASLLPADSCVVFPEISFGILYIYNRVGPGYALIGKNPSNSDEWLFMIHPEGASTNIDSEIWKIDTCSGRKEILIDSVRSQPKINKDGWLLFRLGSDGFMYKLSPDGDSLEAVSDLVAHDLFDWCLDGEAFFYRARFKKMAYLVSINGEVLDSFNLDCHAITGRENRIAMNLKSNITGTYTRLAILNVHTGDLIDMGEIELGLGGPLALAWETDESLIGVFVKGVYRIDVLTGDVELVKETCDNLSYYYPSVDSDNPDWLVLGRQDFIYPQSLHVDFTTSMVMLNTQTGEEWKLDLDQ